MMKCKWCRGKGYYIVWQWVGYDSFVTIICEHCDSYKEAWK